MDRHQVTRKSSLCSTISLVTVTLAACQGPKPVWPVLPPFQGVQNGVKFPGVPVANKV